MNANGGGGAGIIISKQEATHYETLGSKIFKSKIHALVWLIYMNNTVNLDIKEVFLTYSTEVLTY